MVHAPTILFAMVACWLLTATAAIAQPTNNWQGRQCAVVLTYDDALNIDLTNVIPALDSTGLKGTFYLSDYFNGLQQQIPAWRAAAAHGHELGNHTIHHPCEGGRPGREFVQPDTDLRNYTINRLVKEVNAMNTLLYAIDGKTERTFAFPCSDDRVNDTAYMPYMTKQFLAARAVRNEMLTLENANLYNLPSYSMSGQTGEQMIALVKQAMQTKTLLVFLFHGVGGEHSLNVSTGAHRQLLQYLQSQQNNIWIAPMLEVSKYIQATQAGKKS